MVSKAAGNEIDPYWQNLKEGEIVQAAGMMPPDERSNYILPSFLRTP